MTVINITCNQSWDIFLTDKHATLIDVRTQAEWHNFGIPQLEHAPVILNSLKLYPDMSFNTDFMTILLQEIASKSKIFFLCRYGSRSSEAANLALEHGVKNCYNLVDGWSGNEFGLGWEQSGLPTYRF
jgi:rhodanese-related sulfurtransferase